MSPNCHLPIILDATAAAELKPGIEKVLRSGGGLEIDGNAVERIGTAGLQLLAAARQASVAAGQGYRLYDPSPVLVQAARDLALDIILQNGDNNR